MKPNPLVAYLSMEIGLHPSIPTYAGGLGVLAGDTLRSAADLEVPIVGVTLVHRGGYFEQRIGPDGSQAEEPVHWELSDLLEPTDARVKMEIARREVAIRAWRYRIRGETGSEVPIYLLDTDLPENAAEDRRLTDALYGGDEGYRLRQEAVLGIGGFLVLRELGLSGLQRFHLNEGHAALIVLALLEESLAGGAHGEDLSEALRSVRERCVFTTHTPISAGHDRFPSSLARHVLGERRFALARACLEEEGLNMTELALRNSYFVNGVALSHGRVSREMFPGYPVQSITNGVHPSTWVSEPFSLLYDRFLPHWRRDSFSLRYALGIPLGEVWAAHRQAKGALLERVKTATGEDLSRDALTIGFARRATAYKRGTLVLHDLGRLAALAGTAGPLQLVFAGKAHPRDREGKEIIRRIHEARRTLAGSVPIAYLPNYDMELGRLLCSGVDVWLNTPLPPLEASGTSGMKAALNGIPSLSVLDGWWVEGHVEDLTGWAIGGANRQRAAGPQVDVGDAISLYDKLSNSVLPCYYAERDRFVAIMRNAIALNGAFFNTERMVLQYLHSAYGLRTHRKLPSA